MVGTAQFSRILVLDIGRGGESIGRAAEAALYRRSFSFRNSHFINSGPAAAPDRKRLLGRAGKFKSASLTGKSAKRPEPWAKKWPWPRFVYFKRTNPAAPPLRRGAATATAR